MSLYALGLDHRSAPLAIRERVAFSPEQIKDALGDLVRGAWGVREAVILSTCNRTELYVDSEATNKVGQWIAKFHKLDLSSLSPYLIEHHESGTARHAFRVASGLDSMVLGETQILGQVKEAARLAEDAGTLGSNLHQLFQKTFSVAKEVRSQTGIGQNVVSMAAASVQLAERIFERIDQQKVLFIGAGEMVALCATHFAGYHPSRITIANRTKARADDLASRVDGSAISLIELAEVLHEYDVIVSCTASLVPVLGLGAVESAVRKRRHRPMVMVDLGVPRDIEPAVGKVDDVFLYTVDDLARIVGEGRSLRQAAVSEAEAIVERSVANFAQWFERRDVVPTIKSIRDTVMQVREQELERARRALAKGDSTEEVMERLTLALANKLLHPPVHFLNNAEGLEQRRANDVLRRIYGLDDEL